jgi:DNA-binding MarR family transcriptional regulator
MDRNPCRPTFVQLVDSFGAVQPARECAVAYWAGPNQYKSSAMPIKARNIALTRSQAACLIALRHGKTSKSKVAMEAELDLSETATALAALGQLGLARQNKATRTWRATARGKDCRYNTLTDRPRRNRAAPGASGLRLLALLDQPMRGREIAEKLGITHQRVLQLVMRLHARGYVSICDQENILWMVMPCWGQNPPFVSRPGTRTVGNPARVCNRCQTDKARGAAA